MTDDGPSLAETYKGSIVLLKNTVSLDEHSILILLTEYNG